jgi:hypothetical protein
VLTINVVNKSGCLQMHGHIREWQHAPVRWGTADVDEDDVLNTSCCFANGRRCMVLEMPLETRGRGTALDDDALHLECASRVETLTLCNSPDI